MIKVEVNQENKIINKFLKLIYQRVKLESDVWSDIRGVVNYISIYGYSATLILVLILLKQYHRN
jgi:hypothetical protein